MAGLLKCCSFRALSRTLLYKISTCVWESKKRSHFLFLLNECDVAIVVVYMYMVELEGVVEE